MIQSLNFMRTVSEVLGQVQSVPDFSGHTVDTVNYRNGYGDTPLHIVANWGDCEAIRLLVEAGADIILLDNMKPDQVREAVRLVAGAGRLEVSGGINLDNLDSYLIQGIDYISVGALTHSVPAVDMSLILD